MYALLDRLIKDFMPPAANNDEKYRASRVWELLKSHLYYFMY